MTRQDPPSSGRSQPVNGPGEHSPIERAVAHLLDVDEAAVERLPVEIADEVPGNAAKQVAALALQKAGDLVVDPRTVLAWVLTSVGAPSAVLGLLVPVRESGSMLPQALIAPAVRRRAVRKWIWVAGAGGQCLAVGAMAVLAATTDGALAGWSILGALAIFAVARSLASLTSKDVLGRTMPKGTRGQVTGLATVASGGVAITLGAALRVFGGEDAQVGTLAILLGAGALAWAAAGTVFATIKETPSDDPSAEEDDGAHANSALALLRDDAPFRRFVVARTLLLVSALSPPFVIALATEQGGAGLRGLGPFLMSSGIAALLGGRFWGNLADRSSRLTMMFAAGAASGVIVCLLVVLQVEAVREIELVYPMAYLLLALAHTGARVGRKTYVVDLGEGDRRTNYVAVSNTAIGVLLLLTGGLTAAIATLGVEVALATLAGLGLVGVVVSRTLPEVSQGA
jgi:hypothetical protein